MHGTTTARDRLRSRRKQASSTYEIFILVLGVSSLIALAAVLFLPLPAHVKSSLVLVGNGVSLIFLADSFRSVRRAPDKRAYLKWGWLDFLGSIPLMFPLRIARLGRLIRT